MTLDTHPAPFQRDQNDPDDDRLIALSALQHAVYCLRQAALIHLEQAWAENRFTAEGQVLHGAVDRAETRTRQGVRKVNGLSVGSRSLGLYGVCDLVEITSGREGDTFHPVEFKRGKPKRHRADEVQLCAQGMCLEEMTGRPVIEGALFYAEIRRRISVPFDEGLRTLTAETAARLHDVLRSGKTPPPTQHLSRCRACSLSAVCRPDASRRASAARWSARRLSILLTDRAEGVPDEEMDS